MASIALVLAAFALLCAAAAVLLWQGADQRRDRLATHRRFDAQFSDSIGAATAAGADAWRTASVAAEPPESPADAAAGRASTQLPSWLLGAVTVRWLALGTIGWVLTGAVVDIFAGHLAALALLAGTGVLGVFGIWLRIQKLRRRLVAQLPAFLDTMVRLITIGNSIHAAFQYALNSAKSPLQDHLSTAGALVRAGVELDQALLQTARHVRLEEMHMLASVLGLGIRYGGRADVLLERMSAFMRDREQAEQELVALSSETRLSAWVLGMLPIVVGAAIFLLNAGYFTSMWRDPAGRMLMLGALSLQALGAFLLYRLARLD